MGVVVPNIDLVNDARIMRDYRLDVRLKAVSIKNNTYQDFSGMATYSVEAYRENIGFGITNIQVETNASLQPIVEITFKDLYGNSVFTKGQIDDNQNYAALFDWPPPKFDLSFKGYLGKTTKMKLNLKKTDIAFNSSDGSFTIKCSFVPNVWGPFADIPALFLYAVKPLKIDDGLKNIVSFFDLIKIGKQVDVKTKNVSNNYDDLNSKLAGVLGSLSTQMSSGIILPGEEIKGVSHAKQGSIEGFKNIVVYDFAGDSELKNSSDVKSSSLNSGLLSDYLLFKSKVVSVPNQTMSLNKFKELMSESNVLNENDIKEKSKILNDLNSRRQVITDDLNLVEKAISAEAFIQNEKQLTQIVIKEIFSKLGGDTGYILGKILQAGLEGYKGAESERSGNNDIIGKYFPLEITKGSEENASMGDVQAPVPETNTKIFFDDKNRKLTNEWKFVNQFTKAIAEGLGDAAQLKDDFDTQGRKQLIRRVNNLESLQGNPYDSTWSNIVSNILIRSGIWAYLTNNIDPNTPGSYSSSFPSFDNSPETAAKNEIQNITDATLEGLSEEDLSQLRNTCIYFNTIINDNYINFDPDKVIDIKTGLSTEKYDYKKAVPIPVLQDSGIDGGIEISKGMVHNNLFWTGRINESSEKYGMVVFDSNSDVDALDKVNSSETDAKYRADISGQDSPGFLKGNEPPGFVTINGFVKDEDKPGGKSITTFNDYVDEKEMFSYEYFEQAYYTFKSNGVSAAISLQSGATFNKEIIEGDHNFLPLAYCAYSHTENKERTVWNLFGTNNSSESRARLQRGFVKNVFSNLKQRIEEQIDKKKLEVGKLEAASRKMESSIYTQFHHIFYQWYSLIYNDENSASYDKSGNQTVSLFNTGELPNKIEDLYSGTSTQGNCGATGSYSKGFQYIAPLIKTPEGENIDVEDSVIDLDSCYNINANTTVLNVIQNICTKNNFLFFPIAGGDPYNVSQVFDIEYADSNSNFGNRFVILWAPTPESRVKDNKGRDLAMIQEKSDIPDSLCAFLVQIGSTDNALFKNVNVSTDSTKTTAESVVNLQRLVDKQVDNKLVTKNCSTIPVIEGRSYTCEIETIGNAQISPLQYFYLDKVPIFGGLYQIMGVKHTITPNNMITTFKGFKMRYNAGKYGGIPPVTLKSLSELAASLNITSENTQTNPDTPSTTTIVNDSGNIVIKNEQNEPTKTIKNGESVPVTSEQKFALEFLHPKAKPIFASFLNDIQKNLGYTVTITDTYRTIEESARLKKQNSKNATPGNSWHNYGMAIDINLDKAAIAIRKSSSREKWEESGVVSLAKKYNMTWGGDFIGYYDPVHFDLRSLTTKTTTELAKIVATTKVSANRVPLV